jgi:hypothetical protein
MKRLTKKEQLAGHTVNYVCYDNCFDVWSVPKKFMGNAIDRLAAYEETGLEPEEIELLAKQRDLYVDACGELPLKRIRELVQADREGISPCTFCRFNPPSSGDGKPCCMCPAESALRREQDG